MRFDKVMCLDKSILLVWGLLFPQLAWGQSSLKASSPVDCPSSDDISWTSYVEAERLFEIGNQQAQQFLFNDAVRSYQQALTHWNAPRVAYNQSLAYVALERPLDAYHSMVRAVRCGAEPLADTPKTAQETFHSALTIRDQLLKEELARLVLISQESGVEVTMNGQESWPLLNHHTRLVMPTTHTLTFKKTGHISSLETVIALRGQTLTLEVVSDRTFPTWMPWTIAGTGAAFGITGVALYATAFANESTGGVVCLSGNNCGGNAAVPRDATRSALGIGGMVVGATVLLVGLGLLWWSPDPVLQMNPVESIKRTPAPSKEDVEIFSQLTF